MTRMLTFGACLICSVFGAHVRAENAGAKGAPLVVVGVRSILVKRPVEKFSWKSGKPVSIRRGVLIMARIRPDQILPLFEPKGTSAAIFMLNDVACGTIRDPLDGGMAVALCPMPRTFPATLWISERGSVPKRITKKKNLKAARKLASATGRVARVREPQLKTSPYKNMSQILKAWAGPKH
jgi:hypothetical protein